MLVLSENAMAFLWGLFCLFLPRLMILQIISDQHTTGCLPCPDERMNVVEAFVNNAEMRHVVYKDQLRRIPDFQRIAKKFQSKKATLQDCYRVYQSVTLMPKLIECLEQDTSEHKQLLINLFSLPIKVGSNSL